ncbi:hypothetical protein E0M30_16365 [Escherichia coli]|uniref:Lar family restriction alleviation protein n=1 Tax=Escherichia coli TaxID=562 RepID=UPI000907AE1D|nr:Lar family restriction alleviation protein [Escherichia coli]EFA4854918.1 hypothetical protein [Escherichia coli]HDV3429438.1 Lar family restriction alleviation protein [Escherichia coli]HDV3446762.1 Lar family restriction alleviation protein [Escherichia coli]
MSELKPCPFCGDNAMIMRIPESGWRYGQCMSCFSNGPKRPDYEGAVIAWNRRAGDEETNV